jgi:hypothetical protein
MKINVQPFLDIIKSQPLEKMVIHNYLGTKENINKIVCALEFRSETLKELKFCDLNFQQVDLSSISRLECLERLKFKYCEDFTYGHYEALSKIRLGFKELSFCGMSSNDIEALFNSLHSEALLKLTLSDITPKIAKAIKESCPRIDSLDVTICSEQLLDSIIPLICELSSLKFLCISISDEHADILVRKLGDCLTSIECLYLSFHVDLISFEYFINNCKANFNKLVLPIGDETTRKDYLTCVDNFQKVRKSLKVLGIRFYGGWTNEELEIIHSLENQGVNIVFSYYFYKMFW